MKLLTFFFLTIILNTASFGQKPDSLLLQKQGLQRDNSFEKIKNESWCLKNSDTYIRNSLSSSEYVSLNKSGQFLFRIDRCGPCGLSAGTYTLSADTLILNWDSVQTLSALKTFKGPKNFTYIMEEIKNLKFRKTGDALILIEEEADEN
ncbi:MAG: hypothetical protein ACXVPU_00655 [Bacteroidia bacterium]